MPTLVRAKAATDARSAVAERSIEALPGRSDPIRNMHRYYRLDVQLDLFGAWCFIREWGRIGQAGQTRTVLYPTPQAALERQRRRKERRGYA